MANPSSASYEGDSAKGQAAFVSVVRELVVAVEAAALFIGALTVDGIDGSDTTPVTPVVCRWGVGCSPVMSRHTTFKFCLDPTVEQQEVLARHAGAARFAFNQCLRMVKTALTQRKTDPDVKVPWTGFDLINAFNGVEENRGRRPGLHRRRRRRGRDRGDRPAVARPRCVSRCSRKPPWTAVRALAAWSDSRSGKRKGKRVGFPRFKKKTVRMPSFRLRNKHRKGRPPAIRVGDNNRPRSITLPGIGQIGVHDDTRRLRRMLAKGRAKILFATVTYHAGRWWVSLNVEAADLHPAHLHPVRDPGRSLAAGSASTGACRRSGRRPRRRHRGCPHSPMPPKRSPRG